MALGAQKRLLDEDDGATCPRCGAMRYAFDAFLNCWRCSGCGHRDR